MMPPLHVIDQGTGRPIVWIHGFPLSSAIFEPQLAIPGVRHVVADLPGFGSSSPAPFTTIDDLAAIVRGEMAERAIDHAIVGGVSMGGYVALALARHFPDSVDALVLIDTRETPDSDDARRNRIAQIERVKAEGPAFLVNDMFPKMLTADTIVRNDSRAAIVRRAMEDASSEGVIAALGAMASRPDTADVIRTFRRPMLVVVGSNDLITPPSDARRMASLCDMSSLVEIPDAAHLSHVERPELFNTAVADFLERHR